MIKIKVVLRKVADVVAAFFGQVDSDSYKNSAPLWSVIGMVIVGVIAILLPLVTVYAIIFD